jgi:hypothetical protein
MKQILCSVKSFITFDFPFQTDFIKGEFEAIHSKNSANLPEWNTTATRLILTSNYWFSYVTRHFGAMIGLSILMSLMMHGASSQLSLNLLGLITATLISFPILYLFHYRPNYNSLFLPKVEIIKEVQECKQLEQLEKCKQAQLSNFTLTLIFYVFDKATGINSLTATEKHAGFLMQLYGVDKGSLKKNLELILGKKQKLPPRKATEIQNRFNEAYNFFEQLNFPAGVKVLKELEGRFHY